MSTNRTEAIQISRRYASAIYSLASAEKNEAAIVSEFGELANAIAVSDALYAALQSPLISPKQKAAALDAIMAKASPLTKRSITNIAEGGRASLIPTIAEDLRARYAAAQGQVEAEVTSARALSSTTQKQITAALAKATGKSVTLKLNTDASLLGGVKIELGSLRLDATLAGALDHMRAHLLATTH